MQQQLCPQKNASSGRKQRIPPNPCAYSSKFHVSIATESRSLALKKLCLSAKAAQNAVLAAISAKPDRRYFRSAKPRVYSALLGGNLCRAKKCSKHTLFGHVFVTILVGLPDEILAIEITRSAHNFGLACAELRTGCCSGFPNMGEGSASLLAPGHLTGAFLSLQ